VYAVSGARCRWYAGDMLEESNPFFLLCFRGREGTVEKVMRWLSARLQDGGKGGAGGGIGWVAGWR